MSYRQISHLFPVVADHAYVDKLWVVDDRGLNDNWVARYEMLRTLTRLAAAPAGPKRVFIRRGVLGTSRNLVNEHEIAAALEKAGFETVAPELETAEGVASKPAHAEVAVVVEGSAQNHCLLAMPRGSALVVIQPAMRFNAFSKTFADPAGIDWAYVVADAAPGGFCLPTERLFRTLDAIDCVKRLEGAADLSRQTAWTY